MSNGTVPYGTEQSKKKKMKRREREKKEPLMVKRTYPFCVSNISVSVTICFSIYPIYLIHPIIQSFTPPTRPTQGSLKDVTIFVKDSIFLIIFNFF